MGLIVVGLAAFLAVMMGVGFYVSRRIDGDSVNYIVAGRGLVLPLAAATLMAQSLDANATLGNTDLTFQAGFWAGAALPVGLALCLFLTGLFFAEPMNRMNLMTLPDFYRRKYGRTVEVVAALIMVLSFSLLLGGNLVAGGFLFQTFVGTSFTTGVLLIAAIILSYTVTGGLFAVAYTDVIQAVVALAGSVSLIVFVATQYGLHIPSGMGPTALGQLTDPSMGAWVNWASILALGLGDIVAIDFMERVFAADDPETARRACFVGSLGTLVIGVPFSIVALSAGSILDTLGVEVGGQAVLYVLLQQAVPPWLAVLVLAGIVAASLSTGDGAILGTSAALARNVVGIRVDEEQMAAETDDAEDVEGADPDAADGGVLGTGADKLLTATRVMTLPITVLGVFFAVEVGATGMLLLLAFDVCFASLLVPLALGLYWPEMANPPAALTSMLAGSATRLGLFTLVPVTYGIQNTLLYFENPWFTPAFDGLPTFIAPLVSLTVFVTVAVATRDSHAPRTLDVRGRRTILAGGDDEE